MDADEPPPVSHKRKRIVVEDADLVCGPRRDWMDFAPTDKKTKYSAREDATLFASIRAYCKASGLGTSDEDVFRFIEKKEWKNYRGCWLEIARALPHRAPMSVWERARRTLDKNQKKGPWTEEEEQWLIELYEKHGKNYTPIADEMGRWVTSVRDKLRKFESCNGQFLPKDRTKQSWTFEEDCRLIELVLKATNNLEFHVPEGGPFWIEIAKHMRNRNIATCCTRWRHILSPTVEKVGRWNPGENWRLLQNVAEGDWECREDVVWREVCTGLPFTPAVVGSHFSWLLVRYGIDRHDPFDEILEQLAAPLKKAYDEWVAAGKPEDFNCANWKRKRMHKVVEQKRLAFRDGGELPPQEDDQAADALTDDESLHGDSVLVPEEDSSGKAERTSRERKKKKKTKMKMKTKEGDEDEERKNSKRAEKKTKRKDDKKKEKRNKKENEKKKKSDEEKKDEKKKKKRKRSSVQPYQEAGGQQARPTKKRKVADA
jgi:hypothetical protein